jgi:hypothetical protein
MIGSGAVLSWDEVGQTLIVDYDNAGSSGFDYYSEARLITDLGGYDWTAGSMPTAGTPKFLSISYLGAAGNSADSTYDRMYAMIRDDANNQGPVVYNPDATAQQKTTWQDWRILLSDLSVGGSPHDVDLTKVRYLFIGFGERCNLYGSGHPGGTGIVNFDNIRLIQPYCRPEYGPVADFTDDCVVDMDDLEMMAQEWLTVGMEADIYPGNPDGVVNFRDFAVLADVWLSGPVLWP